MKQSGLLKIAILLIVSLPVLFCQKEVPPPCSMDEFSSYFVNPTQERYEAMAGKSAPVDFDKKLKKRFYLSDTGAIHGEWLVDSLGMRYRLGYCTPKKIRSDTAYPLIIYLHGGVMTERSDKGDSAFFMLKALADTFDLFLASPSGNRHAPWWSPAGLSRIAQTLRFMTLHYPVSEHNVFLAGVSDGATGCYAAANTMPGPFAGFIAVSGFGGMLGQVGMELVPSNLRARPIYNVNAGQDRLFPVEAVKNFVAALQSNGVPVTATWYENEQHGFDYRAQEMGTLANLLRTWSRPKPQSISWNFLPGYLNVPDNIVSYSYSSIDAKANGCLRNDTLMLQTNGLSSLSLSFPSIAGRIKIICRLTADGGKARVIHLKAIKNTWPGTLQNMVRSGFPVMDTSAVFVVKP